MAIPNNYIDKITKDDESRLICPPAQNVRVDNDNYDGADLDEVLDEIAESVEAKANSADVYTQAEVRARLPLRITVTTIGGVITSSHEYSEIDNAVREDKRDAYVVFDGNVYNLCQISQSYITFSFVDAEGGAQTMLSININNAWSVEDVPISSEGGYTPPVGGIPKTDLAPAVQTSLGKADTAVQPAALNSGLAGKVDKETGKGLSKNDYTDADKAAVATIGDKADADDVYTKAEVDTKISQAGGGTVTAVKMNNGQPIEPVNGVVDLGTVITQHQDISDKVDKVTGKGLSTNDYTDAEKTKLAGIAAGAEVNVQADWNQTNTNAKDFIKNKPTIPSAYDDTELDGRVSQLEDAVEDIPTKTSELTNDSQFINQTQLNTAIAGVIAGETIAFDAGGTAIIDNMEGANADTTLAAASARVVKEIYNNLKALYDTVNGLASIAFLGTRPTWQSVSKRSYTLAFGTLTGLDSTTPVMDANGNAIANGAAIYEGYLKLILKPASSGYTFTSITVNGESVIPTAVSGASDGSVYIEVVVTGNITLAATATDGYGVSLANGSNCTLSVGSVVPNGTYNGVLQPDTYYDLPGSISAVMGSTPITFDGTTNSYDSSTGAIKISNVTDHVVITAEAVPQVPITVAFPQDHSHMVIKHGDDVLSGNSVNVYPDDKPYELTIQPAQGYMFSTTPTATGGGTMTNSGSVYTLTIGTTDTSDITISAVTDEVQLAYKGIRVESSSGIKAFRVGPTESKMMTPPIDLGADRQSPVSITWSSGYLLAFDSNKQIVNYSDSKPYSVPTTVRYVALLPDATTEALTAAYIKTNGSETNDLFDGATFNANGAGFDNALDWDDFLETDMPFRKNSYGDFVNWSLCNGSGTLPAASTGDNNFTAIKNNKDRSSGTVFGTNALPPYVISKKTPIVSGHGLEVSAGSAVASGGVPTLLAYKSDGTVGAFSLLTSSAPGGMRTFTSAELEGITHLQMMVSKSVYDATDKHCYIKDTTANSMLWEDPNYVEQS